MIQKNRFANPVDTRNKYQHHNRDHIPDHEASTRPARWEGFTISLTTSAVTHFGPTVYNRSEYLVSREMNGIRKLLLV